VARATLPGPAPRRPPAAQGGPRAPHMAELRAPMAAAGNSTQCLQRAACQPLGGHSVWAALPPLPADAGADARPLLLVLAGADGDALFHDRIRVRAGAGTRPRSSEQ